MKHVTKHLAVLGLLFASLLVFGCATLKGLKEAKEDWKNRNYASLATREVSCKASNKGCNQLHLIKGDACFRLAKSGAEVAKHARCAAQHLQTGISQTEDWQVGDLNLNRAQTHENLLESLRLWRDTQRGAEAKKITTQLVASAQAFLQIEPGHLGGIYFLNSGQYTLLRPELLRQTKPSQLCADLKRILQSLSDSEPKSQGTKYAPNYAQLRSEVNLAKTTVTGCS
ncbi:MAG: hypothetical protein ACE5F7_03745 [Nitrospiria bacterium]